MKRTRILLLILALLMLFSACAPTQNEDDHSNIIQFRPQTHEGQCPDADPYTMVN